jgi:hypothetical protein
MTKDVLRGVIGYSAVYAIGAFILFAKGFTWWYWWPLYIFLECLSDAIHDG